MIETKYRNVFAGQDSKKKSFRAVVKRKGKMLLDKVFDSEIEAARAVSRAKCVPMSQLVKLPPSDLSADPLIYKHVYRRDNINRTKPYRANITIKGSRSGKYLGYHRTQLEAAQAVANYLGCDISDIERDKPLEIRSHDDKPVRTLDDLISLDDVINNGDCDEKKFSPRKLPVKRLTIKRRETIVSGRNLVSPIGESSGEGYGW